MALLNWRVAKYSVGVEALDSQHGEFIRALNKLHVAMIRGKGNDVTAPLLRSLAAGARVHFSAEEELLASTHYPDLINHRVKHKEFDAKLEELIERHELGERALSIPLIKLMRNELAHHLLEEDRKYVLWLDEHDVS